MESVVGGRDRIAKPSTGFTLPTTDSQVKSLDACIWRTLRRPLFANSLEGQKLRVPS